MTANELHVRMPPPAPPNKKYRSFQLEAIIRARSLKNVLLADEMGAGKTIETIGIINDNPEVRKVLIVCPASLRINWKRELIRWLSRRNTTIGMTDARRGFPLADIVIINYELLKPFHRNIHAVDWDLLVVDEAHYLKNGQATRTLEIVGRSHGDLLKRRPKLDAKRAIFLTGTPIVNRPFELWPLVHYLAPDEFPDRLDFIAQYCGGKASGQRKQDIGEENLRRLHQKLSETIMIRRLKKDVLSELPPKVRQVLVLPSDSVRGAVKQEKEEFIKIQKRLSLLRLKAELAKCVPNDQMYKAAVAELKQAEFVTIQQITALRLKTALAKVPVVVEHAHNVLDHVQKLVIFAYHTSVIENLALAFGKAVVVLHGKVDPEERQRRVDIFQRDPNCRVLIGAIKASGVGLTMTAAQVALFAELDWTPSGLNQAEDRIHRLGQGNSVLIQHLVLDGSIDAMLAGRVVEKQDTITTAIDDEVETKENLYALSRAKPFVEEDRRTILAMAEQLSVEGVQKIHAALEAVAARGCRKTMAQLDYNLISILAKQDYIEPSQAALGLALLRKHGVV